MHPMLADSADLTIRMLQLAGALLLYVLCFLLPVGALAWVAHVLFSLPLRRRERARFFLDLVETALARGRPLEPTLVAMAESRDRAPGVRFHLLAAHLEAGLPLGEALERVPRLLPPPVTAMLRVGERLGDLRRVLPACREWLRERPPGVQSAYHYLVVVLLVFSPVAVCLLSQLLLYVVPSFRALFADMEAELPRVTRLFFGSAAWVMRLQLGVTLALLLAAFFYVGGPRVVGWLQRGVAPVADWLAWQVPWKRKRLLRTFSAMLAVLLDGGVPEAEAVRLAGDSTANEIARRRARRVAAALAQGVKLPDAVGAFDDAGEYRWRLTNACQAHGGFQRALAGWHEALEARAFQQEEAAAHLITSALVLLNGAVVAFTAGAFFAALIALLEFASL